MIQNIIVLLLVAAALVYTVVWMRRFIAGESKCACGTKSCGPAPSPCGSQGCSLTADNKPGGLPLIQPPCGQGGCAKR